MQTERCVEKRGVTQTSVKEEQRMEGRGLQEGWMDGWREREEGNVKEWCFKFIWESWDREAETHRYYNPTGTPGECS